MHYSGLLSLLYNDIFLNIIIAMRTITFYFKIIILGAFVLLLTGCRSTNGKSGETLPVTRPVTVPSTAQTYDIDENEIIYDIIFADRNDENYKFYCSDKLDLLMKINPKKADILRRILNYWDNYNRNITVSDVPKDLPDDKSLCFVTLGFQLRADGTMENELVKRLELTLECATRYPDAYILVTGGGTAPGQPHITEAGRMREWLVDKGVNPERIIVENESFSTRQNAGFSYEILRNSYPAVRYIAIISSDYHVPSAGVIFYAASLFEAEKNNCSPYTIVAKASCKPDVILHEGDFENQFLRQQLYSIASK